VAEGSKVQAERNSNNNASALEAPPVMPAELSKLRTGAFINDVVDPYRPHVMKFWTADDIDKVENEHKELLVAYSREPGVKAAFDAHDESTFFNVAWDSVKGRFKTLRQFCGGLATAFPNTTSVESDFSVMKWEKDEHRTGLTSLALAGIMHAKQFEVLNSLD
jgi:hypothetical protein